MHKIEIKDLKKLIKQTTQDIETEQNKKETNSIVESLVSKVVDSEFASLWIFDKEKAALVRERNDKTLHEISMLGQQGILAKCFFTLSSGIYNYLASEKGYVPAVDNPDNIKIKSKIIVPIIDKDRFLGMVTAYSSVRKIKNFDQDELELLEAMIPFLIEVIYKMHPELKTSEEEIYMSERLLSGSQQIVKKAEKIQQEQEMVPNNDETVNFLANTVHDIRTPANTLYGFLELLEEQLEDKRLLQYIHNAKESAQFINELTTSILDRVSSHRKRSTVDTVQITPAKFIADIAENFSANMYNKEIQFNIYIDPLLPKEIKIQDVLLKRILMNLLNNAYKFTPGKKSVDLAVHYEQETRSASFTVSDTGIGIAKEKQKEIFEAFSQADETTKKEYGGTGLGLSICSEYVKNLGGELQLQSELDAGSKFYFTIPLDIVNEKPLFPALKSKHEKVGILMDEENLSTSNNIARYLIKMGMDKKQIRGLKKSTKLSEDLTHLICFQHKLNDDIRAFSAQTKIPLMIVEEDFLSYIHEDTLSDIALISQYGYYAPDLYKFLTDTMQKRVLIVDDDKINSELIKAILSNEFCQTETAHDGEEALKMLMESVDEEQPFSLVFLDRHMPKLSGPDVLKTFRRYEKEKHVSPVFSVSISGDSTPDNQDNVFNMHIGKPFNKKKIKKALEKAFNL